MSSITHTDYTSNIPQLLTETFDLVLTLDSEYHSEPHTELPHCGLSQDHPGFQERNLQTNDLLCFQLYSDYLPTGASYQERVDYRGSHRPTLGDLILKTLAPLGIKQNRLQLHPPLRVMVGWHWGSAEMGVLADYKKLLNSDEVVSIHGCVTTLKPLIYHFPLPTRSDCKPTYGKVLLSLRDTQLLLDADTGKSLDKLGDALNMPKVNIERWGYTKDRMDIFMNEEITPFTYYGMQDVKIARHWLWEQSKMQRDILHLDELAPTIGSATANGLKAFIEQHPEHYKESFADIFNLYWSHKHGEYRPHASRGWTESMGVQCFLGGMNQTYHLGHMYGTIMDIDISSAYAGAMGCIEAIDYVKSLQTGPCDPWTLTNPLDFGLVTFSFPEDCQYPCIPISTHHGLIYPLSSLYQGKDRTDSVPLTGPEIHEALLAGATIHVLNGYKAVTKGFLLIAPYLRHLTDIRKNHAEKNDPWNLTAKLYINALFGKFGQGLNKTYKWEELLDGGHDDDEVKRCCITEPRIASTITGITRAVLNVLVREASRLGTVLSATTDGLMLCLPPNTDTSPILATLMEKAAQHPSVQLMLQGREAVGLSGDWLEDKHPGGTHAHTLKTRTYAIWNAQEECIFEAKVGYPKDKSRPDYIPYTDLIKAHDSGEQHYYTGMRLNTIKDVVKGTAKDITSYPHTKIVNVAPDWKRHFAEDGSSKPFPSLQAYYFVRRIVDNLGPKAFVANVEARLQGEPIARPHTHVSSSEKKMKKHILWSIIHRKKGYRLRKGTTYAKVAEVFEVDRCNMYKLEDEKEKHAELPEGYQAMYVKYAKILGLW
jgi:DNA polymerase type B, organellar and viral